MRAWPATAALLLLAPGALGAQRVSPVEVWRACQHPAAFPSDSFASSVGRASVEWREPTPTPALSRDTALQRLCLGLDLPREPRRWYRYALRWDSAMVDTVLRLPRPDAVREYSETLEDALRLWQRQRGQFQVDSIARADAARAQALKEAMDRVTLAEGAILFAANQDTVQPADSTAVRQLAETLRGFLDRFQRDTVFIVGRADTTGGDTLNLGLAARRAVSVRAAVQKVAPDLPFDRIKAVARPDRTLPRARRPANAPTEMKAASEQEARATVVEVSNVESALPSEIRNPVRAALEPRTTGGALQGGSLAVALTDVVIESARKQLELYFVGELMERVCHGEYLGYFNETCALFQAADPSLYRPSLGTLRTSITRDFDLLLPRVVRAQFGADSSAWRREGVVFAYGSLRYLVDLSAGQDPLAAFGALAAAYPRSALEATKLGRVIRHAGPIVAVYDEARRPFLALKDPAEQRRQAAALALRTTAVNAVTDSAGFAEVLHALPTVLDAATRIDTLFHGVAALDSSSRAQRIAAYLGAGVQLIAGAADTTDAPCLHAIALPVRDAMVAVAARNFHDAVVGTLKVSRSLLDVCGVGQPLAAAATTIVVGDAQPTSRGSVKMAPGARASRPTGGGAMGSQSAWETRLRLLAFASDLADARDTPEMEEVIRRYVSEGGGYMSKRTGPRRGFFTVNAYLGASLGPELASQEGGRNPWQAAAFLPVGVEHVWRFGDERDSTGITHGRSFPAIGLLFQLVDLGGLATTRLELGARKVDQAEPDIMQFVAPGAYLVVPLARTPLSLGLGGALAPKAQRVTDASGAQRTAGAVRLGLFLAVDVPLFP